MIEGLRALVTPHFDDNDLNRRAFNLNVVLLVLLVAILLGIVAMLLQLGRRPVSYMLPNTAFLVLAGLVMLLCYYLSRQGRVTAGSVLFVGMLTVACFGAVAVGGTQGALPAILIIPISIAGITLGSGTSVGLAILSVVVLVVLGFLEVNGMLPVEYPSSETTTMLNIFDIGFGLFFATMGIWLAGYSLRRSLAQTQEAVVEAERYRQELEASLTAEQAIRDRLQRAIEEYSAFLERIGRGEFEARLSLAEEDQSLGQLEAEINATVDTLVAALEQSEQALARAEATHSRYVVQSWDQYRRLLPATRFEVGGEADEPAPMREPEEALPAALQSALQQALAQRDLVVAEGSADHDPPRPVQGAALGVPIKLRDQIIGVLGIAREDGTRGTWTEAEQELVAAVSERLALAADGIRLLEDVQWRAAREQVLSQVTGRLRERLDLDLVLQTAAREMRGVLDLAEAEIRLAPGDGGGPGSQGTGPTAGAGGEGEEG